MSNSQYIFNLDIHSTQSQIFLPVVLGDTARTLLINLRENGKPYIFEEGTTVEFSGKKPDGTILSANCNILDNGVVQYDFTSQTASAAGLVECRLRIGGLNNKIISSPKFFLVVD